MYKEYLLDTVLESALPEEAQTNCIMFIESTDDMNVLNSVGIIVQEAVELYESGEYTEEDVNAVFSNLVMEEVEADDLTFKEQQDASGASTTDADGKNDDNENDLGWCDDIEEELNEGIDDIGEDLTKGVRKVKTAVKNLKSCTKSTMKNVDSDDKESIQKELDELEKDTAELDSKCDGSDTTGVEAKTLANKIRVKSKLIMKKTRAAVAKVKKESTEYTEDDVYSAIYEAVEAGVIGNDDVLLLTEGISSPRKIYGKWKEDSINKAGNDAVHKMKNGTGKDSTEYWRAKMAGDAGNAKKNVEAMLKQDKAYTKGALNRERLINSGEMLAKAGASIAAGAAVGYGIATVENKLMLSQIKKLRASDDPDVQEIVSIIDGYILSQKEELDAVGKGPGASKEKTRIIQKYDKLIKAEIKKGMAILKKNEKK